MTDSPTVPADCYDPQSGLVPVAEAQRRVLDRVTAIAATETVSLADALGRVLARPVTAGMDVPPHANSAMDGYAVASASLPDSGKRDFRVVGDAFAGAPWTGTCRDGETVRVTTGAMMPDGADAVVVQEDVAERENMARIPGGARRYQNVRHAGEDMRRGSLVAEAGTRLGAAELGVLASTGIGAVEVSRRPKAAVFSTGNELKTAGETLGAGEIYDSNRYVLAGLLRQMEVDVRDLGIIPDDHRQTLDSLREASASSDLIVTSGGVSTGSADYVVKALLELGELDLWRIAIRPGRPFAFGKIDDALFFGLPGNPVAVMVTFYRLVQPALRKLLGESNLDPVPIVQARATTKFRKKPNRSEVYRAIVSRDGSGEPVVATTGQQGSGLLSSMSQANCFVLLDDDEEAAQPGDMVKVQLFDGIF